MTPTKPIGLDAVLSRAEPFDPAALIRRVPARRPMAEIAGLFGMDTIQLARCIRNLRRDDPDFPVRRRRLRGVIYVEPTP